MNSVYTFVLPEKTTLKRYFVKNANYLSLSLAIYAK